MPELGHENQDLHPRSFLIRTILWIATAGINVLEGCAPAEKRAGMRKMSESFLGATKRRAYLEMRGSALVSSIAESKHLESEYLPVIPTVR